MIQAVTVRVARPTDSAAVERILEASYPALMSHAYAPAVLEEVLPLIMTANPQLLGSGTFYLAEAGDEPVGCGGWSSERPGTPDIEPGLAHLRHFGTAQTWVGRGVGRMIYSRCECAARAAGVRRFECYASLGGEGFYSALGFERIREVDIDFGRGLGFPSVLIERRI